MHVELGVFGRIRKVKLIMMMVVVIVIMWSLPNGHKR